MGDDTTPVTDLLDTSPDPDATDSSSADDTSDTPATATSPAQATPESAAATRQSTAPDDTDTDADTDAASVTTATVFVDSDPITIDHDTTPIDLKEMTGVGADELLTFRPADADQPRQISDDEPVLDYVDPGTKLAFQPAQGDIFG